MCSAAAEGVCIGAEKEAWSPTQSPQRAAVPTAPASRCQPGYRPGRGPQHAVDCRPRLDALSAPCRILQITAGASCYVMSCCSAEQPQSSSLLQVGASTQAVGIADLQEVRLLASLHGGSLQSLSALWNSSAAQIAAVAPVLTPHEVLDSFFDDRFCTGSSEFFSNNSAHFDKAPSVYVGRAPACIGRHAHRFGR